jgi:hypothetical protein
MQAKMAQRPERRFTFDLHHAESILSLESAEIPRLDVDAVDVNVGDVDVSGTQAGRRQVAVIRAETAAVADLEAAPVRRRKGAIPFADTAELPPKVDQVPLRRA